jgi:hypothetical protein
LGGKVSPAATKQGPLSVSLSRVKNKFHRELRYVQLPRLAALYEGSFSPIFLVSLTTELIGGTVTISKLTGWLIGYMLPDMEAGRAY